MYVDNRKEGGNSVRAVLLTKDGSRGEGVVIDIKSVAMFFVVLFGVSLATTGVLALVYSLYLALFFK